MSDKLTNLNQIELAEIPLDQLGTIIGGDLRVNGPPSLADSFISVGCDLAIEVLNLVPGLVDYLFPIK